jgi:RNA polymerase sigma factor (sigma-70 family)
MPKPLDRLGAADAPPESAAMALARASARGDEVATGQLVRMLAPRIGVVVRAIMGANHPDADDALQLALIALVRALPAFRGDCEPLGYASSIAVRIAVGARKRAHTQALRRESEPPPDVATADRDPADAQRRKEMLRQLLAAIPAAQAETLAMRVVLGWSLEEIARHSGVPINTVRSRLRLAKEAMRARIEADADLLETLEVEP